MRHPWHDGAGHARSCLPCACMPKRFMPVSAISGGSQSRLRGCASCCGALPRLFGTRSTLLSDPTAIADPFCDRIHHEHFADDRARHRSHGDHGKSRDHRPFSLTRSSRAARAAAAPPDQAHLGAQASSGYRTAHRGLLLVGTILSSSLFPVVQRSALCLSHSQFPRRARRAGDRVHRDLARVEVGLWAAMALMIPLVPDRLHLLGANC